MGTRTTTRTRRFDALAHRRSLTNKNPTLMNKTQITQGSRPPRRSDDPAPCTRTRRWVTTTSGRGSWHTAQRRNACHATLRSAPAAAHARRATRRGARFYTGMLKQHWRLHIRTQPEQPALKRMMSWSGASTCGWSHRWRPAQPALASPDPSDAQSCSPLRARPVSGSDQEPYSGSCQRSTLAADCGGLTGGVGWVKRLSQASLSVLSLLSRRPPAQCWPSSTCWRKLWMGKKTSRVALTPMSMS